MGQLVEEEEEEQGEGRESLPVVTVEAAGEVEAQRGSRKVDNGEREGREKEKERDAKKENGDNQKEEKKTKKEKEKNGKSGKDKEEKNGGEDEGVVGVPRSALEYWVPVSVCPGAGTPSTGPTGGRQHGGRDGAEPSQGGQYYGITPLEEGVAPARGPTICEARLYAVLLPPWHRPVAPQYVRPHFMRCRSLLQITLL